MCNNRIEVPVVVENATPAVEEEEDDHSNDVPITQPPEVENRVGAAGVDSVDTTNTKIYLTGYGRASVELRSCGRSS